MNTVDREYPQELRELHNDYPLATEHLYIKNKMSNYQLKTIKADFYKILIGTVKKLVHYENLQLFKVRI